MNAQAGIKIKVVRVSIRHNDAVATWINNTGVTQVLSHGHATLYIVLIEQLKGHAVVLTAAVGVSR